jgi:hypothetical protein
MDPHVAANRTLWNEWTPIHVRSAFHDVEGEPGIWRLPEPDDARLPLLYSLKATKA